MEENCLNCKFVLNGVKGNKRFTCRFNPNWDLIADFPEMHNCGRFVNNTNKVGSVTPSTGSKVSTVKA